MKLISERQCDPWGENNECVTMQKYLVDTTKTKDKQVKHYLDRIIKKDGSFEDLYFKQVNKIYFCVNGPKNGEKMAIPDAEEIGYHFYNKSSSWSNNHPTGVLIHIKTLEELEKNETNKS